jgi:beta-1,4-mannosyl-glycoprotein beta-1,4-N-acetylglucosaminyltransferase
MIVDTFTFNNEFDVLSIRLRELYDVVDHFVLVEADRTHRGDEKEMHFFANRNMFAEYLDKIIYLPVTDMPSYAGDAWPLEKHQRRSIGRGLERFPDDALIMVSDVDEIPSREAIGRMMSTGHHDRHVYMFDQVVSYHYLNWKRSEHWFGTRGLTRKNVTDPQLTRRMYPPKTRTAWQRTKGDLAWKFRSLRYWGRLLVPVVVERGGWHLSYMGDAEFARRKIKSFAHAEFDNEKFVGDGVIERNLAEGREVFGNPVETMSLSELPDCVGSDLGRYGHLIDHSRVVG